MRAIKCSVHRWDLSSGVFLDLWLPAFLPRYLRHLSLSDICMNYIILIHHAISHCQYWSSSQHFSITQSFVDQMDDKKRFSHPDQPLSLLQGPRTICNINDSPHLSPLKSIWFIRRRGQGDLMFKKWSHFLTYLYTIIGLQKARKCLNVTLRNAFTRYCCSDRRNKKIMPLPPTEKRHFKKSFWLRNYIHNSVQ